MLLTVWNGSQYVEVPVDLPDRRFDCDVGTFATR